MLSLFPYAIKSESFKSIINCIHNKSNKGLYYAESVVKFYADFDFGQKKEASRWITFLINRIEKRIIEYSK
jgi:hypothetical protein